MEIRRERINVEGMTPKEIVEKYGIPEGTAYGASKRGFFVRNCRRKEVIIDESVFDTNGAYGIAWRVYNTNFRREHSLKVGIKQSLLLMLRMLSFLAYRTALLYSKNVTEALPLLSHDANKQKHL